MQLPFLGRWKAKIDAKRRLTLPSKLRDLLFMESSQYLVLTVGHGGCLFLLPHASWDELTPQLLRDAFQGDPGVQRLRANFARYGSLIRMDNSGRVTLTEDQMQVANLSGEAEVFGNFTRIEIWNPERFEQQNPPIQNAAEHDRLAQRYIGRMEVQEEPRA